MRSRHIYLDGIEHKFSYVMCSLGILILGSKFTVKQGTHLATKASSSVVVCAHQARDDGDEDQFMVTKFRHQAGTE